MLNIKLTGVQISLKTFSEKKKHITDFRTYFEKTVAPAMFKRFGEMKIPVDTGRLRRSYLSKNSDNRLSIDAHVLRYKNLVPYAIYQTYWIVGKLLAAKAFRSDLLDGLQNFMEWDK